MFLIFQSNTLLQCENKTARFLWTFVQPVFIKMEKCQRSVQPHSGILSSNRICKSSPDTGSVISCVPKAIPWHRTLHTSIGANLGKLYWYQNEWIAWLTMTYADSLETRIAFNTFKGLDINDLGKRTLSSASFDNTHCEAIISAFEGHHVT